VTDTDKETEPQVEVEVETMELTKRDRRLMKTSTFEALSSIETKPVEEWEPGILAAVLEDTAAVERSRWIERAWWLVLSMFAIAAVYASATSFAPVHEPQPWKCTIELSQDGEDPDRLYCNGGMGQVVR
jgi:hypothetical protein